VSYILNLKLFDNKLQETSSLIEGELRRVFPSLQEESLRYHQFIGDNYKILQDFVLRRGKRLAASTTLMCYKGYKNNINQDILRICCGIELYRHAILIHDDIVDLENTRRGDKTIHKILGEKYDSRFGWGTAIFLGNILSSLGLILILKTNFDLDKLIRVSDLLLTNYKGVNESQILDLLFEYKNPDVEEWNSMADKRAVTLFRASILTGAFLGDANKEDTIKLENAAVNIGYAFDIQDDIIDTFSSPESYGRPCCGDITMGKRPLHIILTMNKNNEAKKFITNLKNKNLTIEDIEKIRNFVRKSGALQEAKIRSENHAKKAKELIEKTNLNKETKEFFYNITDYIKESLTWYE
jgi:geranylgeranyl pyrophosphate synthase